MQHITGDLSYTYASGTSMAAPVLVGLIANLLSVNDDLSYDDIHQIISTDLYSSDLHRCKNNQNDGNCNGIQMRCDEIIDSATWKVTFYRYYCAQVYDHFIQRQEMISKYPSVINHKEM